MAEKFDVVGSGGGPAGYVCAIRSSQLGLKTACVESRGTLGGTCLNIGCIPSKSLLNLSETFHQAKNFGKIGIEIGEVKLNLEKMMRNKDKAVTVLTKGVEFLFKKNKVTYLKGMGSIINEKTVSVLDNDNKLKKIETKNIVISTGSEAVPLPGVTFDEKRVLSSTGALNISKVPKKMIIIGGGYIGLEMGSVWSRLGSDVEVIENLDHITPGLDREISVEFMKILKKQNIKFNLNTKVEKISKNEDGLEIYTTDISKNEKIFKADVCLVAVGRKPYTKNLNLDKMGIKSEKGKIKVNNKFQTNIDNIYAIGDVIDGPMLAHKAEEEGIAVAELIAGQAGHVNYDLIPGVIYTSPEVAYVGKNEEELKKINQEYKVGKFPFIANSRAKAIDKPDGFVKILADKKTDKVLGVHIIGPHAGEMIAEMSVAMEFGASSEDIARTCHAHPTFSEAIKEAALSVDKRQIHS